MARASSRRAALNRKPLRGGLQFKVAWTRGLVIQAWQLVYQAYLRIGLIVENEQEIHTVPRAIQDGTCVAVGVLRGEVCATISAYNDHPAGLPLDDVYPAELDGLRQLGHRLTEVGLLADHRSKIGRSLDAHLMLMKYAFFWGRLSGATDLVVGVHPHHRRFYERLFGFRGFGQESTCPSVRDAPVVPLRLPIEEVVSGIHLPRGIEYFMQDPLDEQAYARRYAPTADLIRGTLIEARVNSLNAA